MSAKFTKFVGRNFSQWITERKIPNKIHRTSTDILNSLSATVGHDPTGVQYKYYDDPFLIPTSISEKRIYSLSHEAGRKAARWVRQEHYDMFQHTHAQPPVKAFTPMTKESNVQNLRQKLADKKFSTVLYIYKTMKKANEELPDDLKKDVLEILCYFNEEETLPNDFVQERWFTYRKSNKFEVQTMWIDNGLADQLFAGMTKDAHSYNCMIQGMCKYLQVKRAYALYTEALEQQYDLYVGTFNAIIKVGNRIKETSEQKWDFVLKTLETMAAKNIQPNKETLNSILNLISTLSNTRYTKNLILQTLAEFNRIDIRPTLESWSIIVNNFCRTHGPMSYTLCDIIDIIECERIELNSKADAIFFINAISICCNNLNDLNLAKRIHKLLINYDYFLGDVNNETTYYRHYLSVLIANETPEEFMNTYNAIVPSIVIPVADVMLDILKFIQLHSAYDMLIQIWSDIVAFDYAKRDEIIKLMVQLLAKDLPRNITTDSENMLLHAGEIAWNIYIDMQKLEKISDLNLKLIENIMVIVCRSNNYNRAMEIFSILCKISQADEQPSFDSIKYFLTLALQQNEIDKAIECAKFSIEKEIADVEKLQDIFGNITNANDSQKKRINLLLEK